MKKPISWLGRGILVVVLILLFFLFIWPFFNNYILVNGTLNGINRSISKELNSGTAVTQVISFLDSRHIEHSELLSSPQKDSDFVRSPKLDGKRDKVKNQILAIKRNIGFSLLGSTSISMHFYFDEYSRLVEYTANLVCTFL